MSDQLFQHAVRAWLEDGSDRTPLPAIEAVLLAIKTTPQERDPRVLRRIPSMTSPIRLAAALAVAVTVSVVALAYLAPDPGIGTRPSTSPETPGASASPVASASPTAEPTPIATPSAPAIDTSDWFIYASGQNWVGILVPRGWRITNADHDWTLATDAAWPNTGADTFASPDGAIQVSAWSVAVQPGTTVEDWIADYCPRNTSPCSGIEDRAIPVIADPDERHPGLLVAFDGNVQAFFLHGERIWAVAIWRGESDPSVLPYGGARRLLETFAQSMCFDCASPVGATPLP